MERELCVVWSKLYRGDMTTCPDDGTLLARDSGDALGVGRVLGSYRLVRLIGRGGAGAVECLAGAPAFTAINSALVLRRQLDEVPTSPAAEQVAGVPGTFFWDDASATLFAQLAEAPADHSGWEVAVRAAGFRAWPTTETAADYITSRAP